MTRLIMVCFLILCFASLASGQTCNDHIPATTPDTRFTDNGDGTITDKGTGLMWKKCVEGLSGFDCATGTAGEFTWKEALAQPGVVNNGGGFAGYTDWRLPNFKELTSIVERKCYDPAINLTFFPNTPSSLVWSGSAGASYSDYAWYVNFYHGYSFNDNRVNNNRVRLVRGGQ